MRWVTLVLLAAAVGVGTTGAAAHASDHPACTPQVRLWKIPYRARDGPLRSAYVIVPAWYGKTTHPPIPLVISPHGRGTSARTNARVWGDLPAIGGFAVVNPDGQGRRTQRYSWGYDGQIDDLARMPRIVERALPWLRVDTRRVFAVGGSMGGQEAVLLAAERPRLLAGAAAFDAVADLALQYRNFPKLHCNEACLRQWGDPIGSGLQALARLEVGGSPDANRVGYAKRSPLTFVRQLAFSGVPLQLWWSTADRVVIDQRSQSARLFRKIKSLNPGAPVEAFVGRWSHSAEMRATSRLPIALAAFRLLPAWFGQVPSALHVVSAGVEQPWFPSASPEGGTRSESSTSHGPHGRSRPARA